MAIRTLLKFRNLDLTADINDRYTKLIEPGCFSGGEITTVAAQLKVDLHPWKVVSEDGMVVEETSDITRFDTPAGQTTVIAVKIVYNQNNAPLVEVMSAEESAYNALPILSKYIIFSKVVVPIGATQTLSSYIDPKDRNIIDKIGRNKFRGVLSTAGSLPTLGNKLGDIYEVVDGVGGLPHLYSWDNFNWKIMTDSAQLSLELNTHRQNLYDNEKHLTNDEKYALAATSGTPISNTNRLIDNADTRIPSQLENDALGGSNGAPSVTNKYITQEYKLAVPEEKRFVAAQVLELTALDGPTYVGNSGVGTANQHFALYNDLLKREYETTYGTSVSISGVYTDLSATTELIPSLDANVDADGFFNTYPLYIKLSVAADSDVRLLYGKKQVLKTLPMDSLLRRTASDAQVSADTIKTVENIKGRLWDDTPPIDETNKELRNQLLSTKEYLNSVFNGDYVFWNFDKLKNIPEYSNTFYPNVGIYRQYRYHNSTTTYSYDNTTGKVTYSVAISQLTTVVPGDVFLDGLEEYVVYSVSGTDAVYIRNRRGFIPRTINTVLIEYANWYIGGSIKTDDNPRKINLSDFHVTAEKEKIYVREIAPVLNEFHPSGNVAYSIKSPVRSPFYTETRVRLYGGFENVDSGSLARVVANGPCRISVTGFFTDLFLLADIGANSPLIRVFVDNSLSSIPTLDLSRASTISSMGDVLDFQQQRYKIAGSLSQNYPHTVEVEIADSLDDFRFFGFEMCNLPPTSIVVSPGRAYVQTDIVKNDEMLLNTNFAVDAYRRGAVNKVYINRTKSVTNTLSQMLDVDGNVGVPSGVAVSGTPNFVVDASGLSKFSQYYGAGSVIRMITASSEQTLKIASVGPTSQDVVFTTNVLVNGPAIMLLVASTTGDNFDAIREYKRYYIRELGAGGTDFSNLFFAPSDKIYTAEDGITSISGNQIQYTNTNLNGADVALTFPTTSSQLTMRVLACAVDLLIANSSVLTMDVSIDGSGFDTVSVAGSGFRKVQLFFNARYQSHEIRIKNAVGLAIVGFILYEPTFETEMQGTFLAHKNLLAKYSTTMTTDATMTATGGVTYDPFIYGGIYADGISGTGLPWTYSVDFVNSPDNGRFVRTSFPGSYFEHSFYGTGLEIEYSMGSDRGVALVTINGNTATLANFPAATFKGIDSNGEVDMYSLSIGRAKMIMVGLAAGSHIVQLQVQNPKKKNPSSTDYLMAVSTVTEINTNGIIGVTPQYGYRESDFATGGSSFRDERNFDSGALAQSEVITTRLITTPAQTGMEGLASGASYVDITFTKAMTNANYSVMPNFVNTDSINNPFPLFQPIMISDQTKDGFRASWNMPLDSNYYAITYTAIAIL